MKTADCANCHMKFKTKRPSIAMYCSVKCHPQNNKEGNLKRSYGLTLIQYNELFKAQNGLCLGCFKHQSQFNHRLFVDHCHKTGKVRGLLCSSCNRALGGVHDVPETLRRLADYLERNA